MENPKPVRKWDVDDKDLGMICIVVLALAGGLFLTITGIYLKKADMILGGISTLFGSSISAIAGMAVGRNFAKKADDVVKPPV